MIRLMLYVRLKDKIRLNEIKEKIRNERNFLHKVKRLERKMAHRVTRIKMTGGHTE